MTRSTALVFALLVSATVMSMAQRREVRGIVVDSASRRGLFGATVVITRAGDSLSNGAVTDRRGRYVVRGAADGSAVVRVSYVGFRPFADTIDIGRTGGEIDTIRIDEPLAMRRCAPMCACGTRGRNLKP